MNEVSPYITKRVGEKAKSEFEAMLFGELVRRLGELRKTAGVQIPVSDWKAWIVPVATVAAILGTYFIWLVPLMY